MVQLFRHFIDNQYTYVHAILIKVYILLQIIDLTAGY